MTNDIVTKIPFDLWEKIADYFDPADVKSLQSVSKNFHQSEFQKLVWESFFNRIALMDKSMFAELQSGENAEKVFILAFQKIKKEFEIIQDLCRHELKRMWPKSVLLKIFPKVSLNTLQSIEIFYKENQEIIESVRTNSLFRSIDLKEIADIRSEWLLEAAEARIQMANLALDSVQQAFLTISSNLDTQSSEPADEAIDIPCSKQIVNNKNSELIGERVALSCFEQTKLMIYGFLGMRNNALDFNNTNNYVKENIKEDIKQDTSKNYYNSAVFLY